MDGSMWYEHGGGGRYAHVDGPFAPPEQDPVVDALGFEGFGGLGQTGDSSPLVFSPEEQTAVAASTAAAIERLRTPGVKSLPAGEKATIEELLQQAAQWSAEQSRPWYNRPRTWTWIIGGTLLVGGGYAVYRYTRRPR